MISGTVGPRIGPTPRVVAGETAQGQAETGTRPTAWQAEPVPEHGESVVMVTAVEAQAAAVFLRKALSHVQDAPRVLEGLVNTLEAAMVAPQAPMASLVHRAGQPDAVLIPAELGELVATVLGIGLAIAARSDRMSPPPDMVALRARLHRAPLVVDLARCSARETPTPSRAHDAPVFLSPTQYAERRGCSSARVRRLCRDGRVTGAHKPGRDWQIPADARIIPST